MIEELLPIQNIESFTFKKQPYSLPAELRPMWKISQILLVLRIASRMNKASILKLQLFNWALVSRDNMKQTLSYFKYGQNEGDFLFSLDPAVNRAIEFANAEHLIQVDDNGKVLLSEKGLILSSRIIESEGLMEDVKGFLNEIGKGISEIAVREALKR